MRGEQTVFGAHGFGFRLLFGTQLVDDSLDSNAMTIVAEAQAKRVAQVGASSSLHVWGTFPHASPRATLYFHMVVLDDIPPSKMIVGELFSLEVGNSF